MIILAIDLGKFNSMCCFFDTATQEHWFWKAATTRSYLTTIFRNSKIDLVVMEACGPSGWVSDLCREHRMKTLVCSTNEEAWWWRSTKRKTDKDDALKLARLAMMQQLKPVHVPTLQGREHRTLVKYRKTLDERINRLTNSIRSLFAKLMDSYRKPLADCSLDELWKGQLDRWVHRDVAARNTPKRTRSRDILHSP